MRPSSSTQNTRQHMHRMCESDFRHFHVHTYECLMIVMWAKRAAYQMRQHPQPVRARDELWKMRIVEGRVHKSFLLLDMNTKIGQKLICIRVCGAVRVRFKLSKYESLNLWLSQPIVEFTELWWNMRISAVPVHATCSPIWTRSQQKMCNHFNETNQGKMIS